MRTRWSAWWRFAWICSVLALFFAGQGRAKSLWLTSTDSGATFRVPIHYKLVSPWLQGTVSAHAPLRPRAEGRWHAAVAGTTAGGSTGLDDRVAEADSELPRRLRTSIGPQSHTLTEAERWSLGTIGALTSLGTRTVSLLPIGFAFALGGAVLGASGAPLLGLWATSALAFTVLDSAVSAWVMQMVYNHTHAGTGSAFLPLWSAHLMGNLFAAGFTGVGIGGALLVVQGAEALAPFVAREAINLLIGMTALGILPITVLCAAVSLVVPAYLVVEVLSGRGAGMPPKHTWSFFPSPSYAEQRSMPNAGAGAWLVSIALPEMG